MNNTEQALNAVQATVATHRVTRVVFIGFMFVLTLMITLGYIGGHQMKGVTDSIVRVVEINNKKISYAFVMRDAIRQRSVAIHAMLSTHDYFERDQLLLKFYAFAGVYRRSREQLVSLGIDEAEQEIHEKLLTQITETRPIVRQAAELVMEDVPREELDQVMGRALSKMDKILGMLDDLIHLQETYANDAVSHTRLEYERSIWTMVIIGSGILVIGLIVARVVSVYVRDSSKMQADVSMRAEHATNVKSDFLANMSHEIRTPLNAIIGYSEILHEEAIDDDHEVYARDLVKIQGAGKHLLALINEILDLSKIEAGQMGIYIEETSLDGLVDDVLATIAPLIEKNDNQLIVKRRTELGKITTDITKWQQILLNIVSNATKFTQGGEITVSIERKMDAQMEWVFFEVKDTGIGMSREQLSRVFEPFTQADNSTTRKYGGTGLGLAITKSFCTMLGGEVSATSVAGEGTVFMVRLPAITTSIESATGYTAVKS